MRSHFLVGLVAVAFATGCPSDPENPPGCASDAECGTGKICSSKACVAKPGFCNTAADCTDPAKKVCTANTCTLTPGYCTSTAECKDASKLCDTTTNTCKADPNYCTAAVACADTTKVCDVPNTKCVTGNCTTDSNCTDATKPVCTSFNCTPKACTVNTDCSADNTTICIAKTCQANPSPCNADGSCAQNFVCTDGTCPSTCTDKSQCASTFVCTAGSCVAPPPVPVLSRPSKSDTVAITDDDRWVLIVNADDNSLSVFDTTTKPVARKSKTPTGKEPSSVVVAPDRTTAYVSNRADATVVKVTGIDTASPTVSAPLAVGSEPTGLALSPTGATLYVAEYAEGTISVIDTSTMTITKSIAVPDNGHVVALTVTNNGNQSDSDEFLVAPLFLGVPNSNSDDVKTLDNSRDGQVLVLDTATLTPTTVKLSSRDSTVVPTFNKADGTPNGDTVQTSPNQLWSVTVRRDATNDNSKAKLYLTSIAASPKPPVRFDGNVYAIVYVINLGATAGAAVEATGEAFNLAQLTRADTTAAFSSEPKRFMTDIVDMAFKPASTGDSQIAYIISRGGDTMQRVKLASDGTLDPTKGGQFGSTVNRQVDLGGKVADLTDGCKGPTGIVITNAGDRAFVNCWLNRRVGVVNLGGTQALDVANTLPQDGLTTYSDADKGRRFFFTGRGRWSGNGTGATDSVADTPTKVDQAWESCASCHPNGHSDGVTWIFADGPRQTTSLDGSFSHGANNAGKQRIFNWTGVFDEVHDFERNTRAVSGGMGAVTSNCGTLATETRKKLKTGLGQPVKDVIADDTIVGHTCTIDANGSSDWDKIEAYMKGIRPPRGQVKPNGGVGNAVHGKVLFNDVNAGAGCITCHGGAGWTASRRFWTPSTATNASLVTTTFKNPSAPFSPLWNNHGFQIETELPAATPPANQEVACVIRNLTTTGNSGTFGPAALEKRPNPAFTVGGTEPQLTTAEGASGFNIPSLYGVALGAPYLHNGEAKTLQDLLDPNGKFVSHLIAGDGNFTPSASDINDLIAFLLSIDASTSESTLPTNADACLASFP